MDPLQILCGETDTEPSEWEEIDGPQSRVGIDSWFKHPERGIWLVNEDQGHLSLSGEEPE